MRFWTCKVRIGTIVGRRQLSSIHLDGFGNPLSVLRFDAKPAAVTQAGDVHIAVSHAAVTAEDVAQIRGESLLRRSVGLAGSNAVGRIVHAAPGARSASGAALQQGQHVLVLQDGTWADQVGASARNVFVLPAGAESNAQTALLPLYVSAWALLRHVLDLKAGEKVLQTAGWTPLGHAISQVGKALNIQVDSPSEEVIAGGAFGREQKGKYKYVVGSVAGKALVNGYRVLGDGGWLALVGGVQYRPWLEQSTVDISFSSAIFRGASICGFNLAAWAHDHPHHTQQAVSEVSKLISESVPYNVLDAKEVQRAVAGQPVSSTCTVLAFSR